MTNELPKELPKARVVGMDYLYSATQMQEVLNIYAQALKRIEELEQLWDGKDDLIAEMGEENQLKSDQITYLHSKIEELEKENAELIEHFGCRGKTIIELTEHIAGLQSQLEEQKNRPIAQHLSETYNKLVE